MPIKHEDDERVYITASLKVVLDNSTQKKRDAVFEAFDHLTHGCKELKKLGDPLSVAYSIHQEIDERMHVMLSDSPYASTVKCQKGCSHCCRVYVGIFPEEARLLRAHAAEIGVEIDEARLERQARKSEATWHELSPEDRRCVFLGDDEACRVYEHRPGNCRKYLVNTDPQLCDADKYRGHDVGVVYSLQAEVMHSAAMTVFGQGSDSMAAVLLAEKGGDNKE